MKNSKSGLYTSFFFAFVLDLLTTTKEENGCRYDYRELDRFLVEEHDPELLAEQLEGLMGDLVYVFY